MLEIATTTALIRARARRRAFLSFGEVAFASEAPWARARRQMGPHLKQVCADALAAGGPLVSAIVINAQHIRTGAMAPETLAGFLASARDLGLALPEDGGAFLRAHQEATFVWVADATIRVGLDPDRPCHSWRRENESA